MLNFGGGNPGFCGMNPSFQNSSGLNPRVFDPSGSAGGYGPQFVPGAVSSSGLNSGCCGTQMPSLPVFQQIS